jgi:hypothetical protein
MFRNRLQENQPQRARQMFEERMAALFERLPMLAGFCVEGDLSVTEISVDTWPGWSPTEQLHEEIGRILDDLVEERPDTAELLRNRTFARALQ